MAWMKANKVKPNPDKSRVLSGLRFGTQELDCHALGGVALPVKDQVCRLNIVWKEL